MTVTDSEVEAFLTVCRCGSITKAAEQLFINQSSLSTKIKLLENEVGCPLIERGKGARRLSLTDEGRRFYEMALKYEELVGEMLSVGRKIPVTLRVSAVNSIGTYIFSPVYERFMQRMPDVVLEVQDMITKLVYDSLENGLTDVAFTVQKLELKRVVSCPVFSEKMAFICQRDSEYPERVALEDIDVKNEIYIKWCFEFMGWHDEIFGTEIDPHIRLDLMSQLELFMKKKNAWAIVPASVAEALEKGGSAVRRNMAFDVPNRIIYCSVVPNKAKAAAIKCFMDCLKITLEEMADEGIEIFSL